MKLKKFFTSEIFQPKKKRPSIMDVFNWIWLGVLLFLIITSLVYKAPWKVNTVLLIFFLGCTVFPRKFRKWFWVGVGCVFLYFTIWVLLPDQQEWKPYQYKPEKKIELINAKGRVSKEDNAATIFSSILEDYSLDELVPNNATPDDYTTTQMKPWSSKDYPEILFWLSQREDVIVRYIKGANKKHCHYPVLKEDMGSSLFKPKRKHLRGLHFLSLMMLSSAANDLGQGRIDEALLKQAAVLRVSEQLCQQYVINDMLAGIDIQGRVLNQIQIYIVTCEAPDEYLEGIEHILSNIEYSWKKDWERIADYEQLNKMHFFCWQFYETNKKGQVRIKILNYILPVTVIKNEELPYWPKRIARVQNILFWFFLPGRPEGLDDAINSSIAEYAYMEDYYTGPRELRVRPSFDQFQLNFSSYVKWYMNGTVFNIFEEYMRHKIEVQSSRLLIALRRYRNKHGYWPLNLEDVKLLTDEEVLLDPLNSEQFVYKSSGNEFMFYSKGFNGIDDEGIHWRYNVNCGMCDDWQIWPPR